MLYKVEKIIKHLIITCNDDTSVYEAKYVTYEKGMRETIAFLKSIGGGGVIL